MWNSPAVEHKWDVRIVGIPYSVRGPLMGSRACMLVMSGRKYHLHVAASLGVIPIAHHVFQAGGHGKTLHILVINHEFNLSVLFQECRNLVFYFLDIELRLANRFMVKIDTVFDVVFN